MFSIGKDHYTSNGRRAQMDSVPYLKDGRTYLPLRYVGLSLGVNPGDIKWGAALFRDYNIRKAVSWLIPCAGHAVLSAQSETAGKVEVRGEGVDEGYALKRTAGGKVLAEHKRRLV
ncbi:MAG: stalk domain-containing protein [Bacillota bacterium]